MPIVEIESDVTLKNCPFCGETPVLRGDNQASPAYYRDKDGVRRKPIPEHFWVKCTNRHCGISTLAAKSQSDAISAWNVRA